MAIEKNIKTRIILTHDDYANFEGIILKNGEVVLAKVGETEAAGEVSEAIWMMKVGDGTSTFENCPWLVAPAADVYEWAKKAKLDWNDVDPIPGPKLGITVTVTGEGNAITNASWDVDTKTLTLTKGETFATTGYADGKANDAKDVAIADAAGKYETKGTAQGIVDALKLDETYEPIGAESRAIVAAKTETENQVKALADTLYTKTEVETLLTWGSF
jgi:hypothetical protein